MTEKNRGWIENFTKIFNFMNTSVKSNANGVAVFNLTNFSVKSNTNKVAVFNLTYYSVKWNAKEVVESQHRGNYDFVAKISSNQLFLL